jgi:hypothetical protein
MAHAILQVFLMSMASASMHKLCCYQTSIECFVLKDFSPGKSHKTGRFSLILFIRLGGRRYVFNAVDKFSIYFPLESQCD